MTEAEIKDAVAKTFAYLASPEGRESMRRANEEAKLMAERFRKMHDISWEDLNRPFTI